MSSMIPQVGVAELADALEDGAFLLDVRQPDEWTEARVDGGRLIPLGEVQARVAEIPTDTPVYVVCRSGGRSQQAAEWLRLKGVQAVNVTGGTLAWIESGRPVSSGPAT